MAELRKPLLVLAALVAAGLLLAARAEVRDAEAEAALWAEATDPVK